MNLAATGAAVHPVRVRLLARQAELRAVLQSAADAAMHAGDPSSHEVLDFKDVAAEDTRALVAEAALSQAADALALVIGALHRLETGTYGECVRCGEHIDPRRLQALPSTPFCTPCQFRHERAMARR